MKARLRKKIGLNGTLDSKGRYIYLKVIYKHGRPKIVRTMCRVDRYFSDTGYSDPYMEQSGCLGDFFYEWKVRDRYDGCPKCRYNSN